MALRIPKTKQPYSSVLDHLPKDGKQRYLIYTRDSKGKLAVTVHDTPHPPLMVKGIKIVGSTALPRKTVHTDRWNHQTGE